MLVGRMMSYVGYRNTHRKSPELDESHSSGVSHPVFSTAYYLASILFTFWHDLMAALTEVQFGMLL